MVMAKLYIICGNCGCSDEFIFYIDPKGNDYGSYFTAAVRIVCNNCSTIHSLDDTVKEKEDPR